MEDHDPLSTEHDDQMHAATVVAGAAAGVEVSDVDDANVHMASYDEIEYMDDLSAKETTAGKHPRSRGAAGLLGETKKKAKLTSTPERPATASSSKFSLTSEMKSTRAATRVIQRLGLDRVQEIQTDYAALKSKFGETDYEKANMMIRNLMAMGLSQIEIRGILGVGGYRLQRLYSSQTTKPVTTEPLVASDALLHIPVLSTMPHLVELVTKKLSMFPLLAARLSLVPLDVFHPPAVDAAVAHLLEDAPILLADPAACVHAIPYTRQLKWAQLTSPSVDAGMFEQAKRDFALTRAGGICGPHVAQTVLGWIIAKERSFEAAAVHQAKREFIAMPYRHSKDVTVGILGCGDMGMEVAKLVVAAGFGVVGLKRQPPVDNVFGECGFRITHSLETVLAKADYLVHLLPSTPLTDGLLAGDVLRGAKKKPALIFVGPAMSTANEAAVLHALKRKWLSSAVVDVVTPPDVSSELWTHSMVAITPHVAPPTMAEDVANIFVKNLWLFMGNAPLTYHVDWGQGY
ncbi:Aste57867_10111 [Aphanomyces stellatus]|uniref:Aste57867_10111 protein n=1 Tax=Aphanomyces stellatus TaxID=120398 RepID=A0A485KPK0_9STRA|nr:hypothetical protein As57867_010072 [Aphanomyces stellatus]VFT86987.1 Aste57867_10111 [Aphanomyces stellatus]